MPDKGWHRPFDDPIRLPDGRELRTLADAGHYVAALPKAVQQRHGACLAGRLAVTQRGPDLLGRGAFRNVTVPPSARAPGARAQLIAFFRR
jgi:hypothetical protein